MQRVSSDKGSVLVISIIGVIVVLSLLGATTMVVPVMTRTAKTEINYNLALQAAESGLQYAIAWINDPAHGIDDFNTSFPYLTGHPCNITNGGSFTISYDDAKKIIASEGKYINSTRKLAISISFLAGEGIFDHAIYAGSGDDSYTSDGKVSLRMLDEATIHGDAIINTAVEGGIVLEGDSQICGDLYIAPQADPDKVVVTNPHAKKPNTGNILNLSGTMKPVLPEFPTFPSDLPDKGSLPPVFDEQRIISASGSYTDIRVIGKGPLVFDLSKGDLKIRTKQFIACDKAKIKLEGTGTLRLYIDDIFDLNGPPGMDSKVHMNWGDKAKSDQLVVYYAGADHLRIGDKSKSALTLYVQKADFTLNGKGDLVGTIISGGKNISIDDKGSGTLAIYAPNATATFTEKSKLKGALVAKRIVMSDKSSATWDADVLNTITRSPIPIEDCSTSGLLITNWRLMN